MYYSVAKLQIVVLWPEGKYLCFECVFFSWNGNTATAVLNERFRWKESVSIHIFNLFLISGNTLIEKCIFFLFQEKYIWREIVRSWVPRGLLWDWIACLCQPRCPRISAGQQTPSKAATALRKARCTFDYLRMLASVTEKVRKFKTAGVFQGVEKQWEAEEPL